jgi:hypothetical protein
MLFPSKIIGSLADGAFWSAVLQAIKSITNMHRFQFFIKSYSTKLKQFNLAAD